MTKTIISILAVVLAALAALFWMLASKKPPLPPIGAFAEQVMPAVEPYNKAVKQAALMNRVAAGLSLTAAVLGFIVLMLPAGK